MRFRKGFCTAASTAQGIFPSILFVCGRRGEDKKKKKRAAIRRTPSLNFCVFFWKLHFYFSSSPQGQRISPCVTFTVLSDDQRRGTEDLRGCSSHSSAECHLASCRGGMGVV
ncbi:hypothetical protein CEXT_783031 [Caerostris extrusa]|uniref:Secreted protein n=1 Tax=Caerostris extrusa TaxID=172846 RepID=A0AAV4R2C7_CAEEX|nr:hypothetical protein CEXT_783031 [Caerostris extrusa]